MDMPTSLSNALPLDQHSTDQPTREGADDVAALARQSRRLSMWARVVLVPVAVIGAVLSYQSLYKAAEPTFGPYLAAGFPLLVDLLILGASLQYVAGAKIGRPMTGWRLTAHCGVAGTLVLNALAARELGEVPWHVTAPAVWAVLVELTGKQVLGQWRAAHRGPAASIAPSLWLSAPIESIRTRLLMARTGLADAHQARIGVGTAAAAREALNLSLPRRVNPRRDARRVRRVVNRQLRAGSLAPEAVMDAVGWSDLEQHPDRSPETILRAVVQSILRPEPAAHLSEETTPADVLISVPTEVSTSLPEAETGTGSAPVASAPAEAGQKSGQPSSAPEAPSSAAPPATVPAPQPIPGPAAVPASSMEAASALTSASASAALVRPRMSARVGASSAVTPAGGIRPTMQQQEDRLAVAVRIVQARPQITGPELRIELAGEGWLISDRTAARILSEARRVPVLQDAAHA
jgi:hypothetical protein